MLYEENGGVSPRNERNNTMEKIENMFVIDGHCDSIQKVDEGQFGIVNPYNYSRKYPQLQFVAMFCGRPKEDSEQSYNRALRYIAQFKIHMETEKDRVVQCRTYEDIERAFAAGKHGAMLTVEGATGLKGSVSVLDDFYAAGVRVMGLAWLSNDLAKSNRIAEGEEDTGLTDTGREIVEEGNRLGMIFDVSHLSDKSFWDLAEISKKPIVATHSNLRSLASHTRNLTEDMAVKIAESDGMIGLNLCTSFIDDNKENRTVARLFEHLDRFIELTGEDHIGFGGDVDGIGAYPAPLTKDDSIHDQLIEFMLSHNYSEALVRKVAGENWMNFLRKYL